MASIWRDASFLFSVLTCERVSPQKTIWPTTTERLLWSDRAIAVHYNYLMPYSDMFFALFIFQRRFEQQQTRICIHRPMIYNLRTEIHADDVVAVSEHTRVRSKMCAIKCFLWFVRAEDDNMWLNGNWLIMPLSGCVHAQRTSSWTEKEPESGDL